MATRIQVRRDTSTNWTNNNPTLAEGEIGFETDTGLLKVGKNNTSWTSLEYSQMSLPYGGYAYNIPRNENDPSFSNNNDIDFSTIGLGSYVGFYRNLPGAYSEGDQVRVTFENDQYAWIEGFVTYSSNDSYGNLTITVKDWSKDYTSLVPQSSAKVSLIGEPGLGYDIYPTIDNYGNFHPIGNSLQMSKSSEYSQPTMIAGAKTLFKEGDWIKAVYIDRDGSIGTKNTVYPDVYFEGYIYSIVDYGYYAEYYIVPTKVNGGSQEGNYIYSWTTGLLPEPKPTYEFPKHIIPAGDSGAGMVGPGSSRPAPGDEGTNYKIYGQVGLYQVGQKIRMQALDEFYAAIPGSYAILEVTEIEKYEPGIDEGLYVTVLEVNESSDPNVPQVYYLSFSLHASDGPQGPGYEVTWDENIHALPDDVSTVWYIKAINQETGELGPIQQSWAVADKYTVPGDFSNSAYRVGDYVKYYFNDPSDSASPYIEGWIHQLDPAYATITIQRWSNTFDWSTTVASAAEIVPIFPAHFEPGYNFDMRINVDGGYTAQPYTNISYPTFVSDIEYGYPRSFYGYHRGSYNPGDYVVISSRSNPGIKVFAYIGSIGYSNFVDQFYIYPLEILTWDASEIDEFNDWTLSIASPPKKEYKLSNPLPLPWDGADPPPAPPIPAAPFQRPEVTDIVEVSGDSGLFKVGDPVKVVSKSESNAAFYGVMYDKAGPSNEFTNQIEVTDISLWTVDPTNAYYDWQLILGEKPVEYQLLSPENVYPEFGSSGDYYIQESDVGKILIAGGGTATFYISNSLNVPAGSQITILQSGGNSGDVGVNGASFIETSGYTNGQVQLKGPYGAATIVKIAASTANGDNWIVVGNFLSATPPPT